MTALRSGEYTQTTWRLARVNDDGTKSYCCQGVAFERYHDQFADFKLSWDDEFDSANSDVVMYAHYKNFDEWSMCKSTAPTEFWLRMGLIPEAGEDFVFVLPDGLRSLDVEDFGGEVSRLPYASMNDSGFTFAQIADMIEWQFLSGTEVTA